MFSTFLPSATGGTDCTDDLAALVNAAIMFLTLGSIFFGLSIVINLTKIIITVVKFAQTVHFIPPIDDSWNPDPMLPHRYRDSKYRGYDNFCNYDNAPYGSVCGSVYDDMHDRIPSSPRRHRYDAFDRTGNYKHDVYPVSDVGENPRGRCERELTDTNVRRSSPDRRATALSVPEE